MYTVEYMGQKTFLDMHQIKEAIEMYVDEKLQRDIIQAFEEKDLKFDQKYGYSQVYQDDNIELCIEKLLFNDFYVAIYDKEMNLLIPKKEVKGYENAKKEAKILLKEYYERSKSVTD